MKRKPIILLLTALLGMFAASCDKVIYDGESNADCVVSVRFKFDFNLKYADAFRNEVHSVALYVFDKQGKFVTKAEEGGVKLSEEGYILEIPGLASGIYDLVAWCGLQDSDSFSVADPATKEELECRLRTQVRTKAQENYSDKWLGSLFYGYVENADLLNIPRGTVSTIIIPLVKVTNSVTVLLQAINEDVNLKPEEFDFVIYEYNDCLGWDGNIHTYNPITYLPFNTKQGSVLMNDGTQLLTAAVAELSIGRLFKRSSNIARLVITQRSNGKTIFDIPLVDYVLMVKGHYVTDIPDQEYLDRQDDFSVAVFLEYRKAPSGKEGEFIAAQVYINGWQIVLQNSGLER